MKRIIALTLMIITIAVQWQGCKKPEETGSIYGTVTDFDTGEPVKNANVKLQPSGETTMTGSDGTYMFQDLKKGDYSLSLSKAEYEDLNDDYVIQLAAGRNACRDVQMKKKVALMRITDMNGEDITVLDFGDEGDDVSRIFNIFNDSGVTLSWEITTTANWIQTPANGTVGTLQAGETKGIVVVIDRSKLQQGDNTTTMHITSNNGNQQLTIKARRADVSTLDATDISGNSAVLNGKINGNVTYSEKGFYYGTNHNLSSQVTVSGNGIGAFSKQVTGLSGTVTYYFKAYCIVNGECLYGEEKSFGPLIPSFNFNGHTYMVAPDPGNEMEYDVALSYCTGLTLYGYSDWKMPTIDELMQMYVDRNQIGSFQSAIYWSSSHSVSSSNRQLTVNFTNGNTGEASNFNGAVCHVRPIRVAD